MIGWIGDFFRFWWALFYWNTRKGWFRLHGAHRDDCPCQNASDSGLAGESRCDAVIQWNRPERFRRVCPLLKETPEGLRCSVEAERVRPFWGRAVLCAAGALLGLYLAGTGVAYTVLRAAKYDLTYLTVAWPPKWKELRGAQEKLYAARAQTALQQGNYQEAILSLEMVCQLNPRNYSAGLALAGLSLVAARPHVADHIYERLMRDVPEQRVQTAQLWFRLLLARGNYPLIFPLAAAMLSEDPEQRGAWLNALLFAARHSHGSESLRLVLQQNPHLPEWCTEIINLEQALLENRLDGALPGLTRVHHTPPSPYLPLFQVDRLLLHGRADQADTLLNAYGNLLPADEAAFLRLRVFRTENRTGLAAAEYDNLLQYPMTPRLAAKFCAALITAPAPTPLAGYLDKFLREGPAISADTVALYHATYLAAALAGDPARAGLIRERITKFTAADARALNGLGELLKSGRPDARLSRILPLVPLPTEVIYAILERSPATAPQ
ncbi:MAG: hypothetical protein PSU94_17140 [Lacunisphaera sp.]|nr:hypothetical protein [Lacunisphaera sp.]